VTSAVTSVGCWVEQLVAQMVDWKVELTAANWVVQRAAQKAESWAAMTVDYWAAQRAGRLVDWMAVSWAVS
jgi:hypothetical protein